MDTWRPTGQAKLEGAMDNAGTFIVKCVSYRFLKNKQMGNKHKDYTSVDQTLIGMWP